MRLLLFKCILFGIWLICIHSYEFLTMPIKCLRSYAGDCTSSQAFPLFSSLLCKFSVQNSISNNLSSLQNKSSNAYTIYIYVSQVFYKFLFTNGNWYLDLHSFHVRVTLYIYCIILLFCVTPVCYICLGVAIDNIGLIYFLKKFCTTTAQVFCQSNQSLSETRHQPCCSSYRQSFAMLLTRYLFQSSTIYFFYPCGLGDQNSANVCPCACRKSRLTKGYKLSYTTGLLHAWPSCMQ